MSNKLAELYNWLRWRRVPSYKRQTHRLRRKNNALARLFRKLFQK